MAIDTSGKWWRGFSQQDLEEYLRAYGDESYAVDEVRFSRCRCGGEVFRLHVEQDEGIARRTCVSCELQQWIADSEENYERGLRLKPYRCIECKRQETYLATGFSLNLERTDVRWLYVGQRCAGCGILGVMVEWKVGYGPSMQLLDQA